MHASYYADERSLLLANLTCQESCANEDDP